MFRRLLNKYDVLSSNSITYQQLTCYCSSYNYIIQRCLHKDKSQGSKSQMTSSSEETEGQHEDESRFSSYIEELKSSPKLKLKFKRANVFDDNVADALVTKIIEHRNVRYAPILEIQAGAGVLSRKFLQKGISKVISTEYHKEFRPLLMEVQEEFGKEKFEYFDWAFLSSWAKLSPDRKDYRVVKYQTLQDEVTRKLHSASEDYGKNYSVLVLGDRKKNVQFLKFLTKLIPWEDPILSRKDVDFYTLMHPESTKFLEILQLQGVPGVSVFGSVRSPALWLIHLFYDVEVIHTVHARDFWPPLDEQKYKIKKRQVFDTSLRYLVKIKLKENINYLLPLHQHHLFSYFLKQVKAKSLRRTIPTIEKLVPGCGLRILPLGINMVEKIRETPPERLLELYKNILNWPEYMNSPLHDHITKESMGIEMEENEEEDDDEINEDEIVDDCGMAGSSRNL